MSIFDSVGFFLKKRDKYKDKGVASLRDDLAFFPKFSK